jgi:hypothetical protein
MTNEEKTEKIGAAFFSGDINKLKNSRCPYCGGKVRFSAIRGILYLTGRLEDAISLDSVSAVLRKTAG